MYGAGLVFLVIAVVAALFGFGVVSDDDPLLAKACAAFFLLAALAAFGWAWLNRSRPDGRPVGRGPRERIDERETAFKGES
jgi:uncharacterized membrane protein YtjA (UPF0391 family)